MNKRLLINRRNILVSGAGAALASLVGGRGALGDEKGPPDGSRNMQAPGFFRFKLGDYTITVLSDGGLVLPSSVFGKNMPEAQVKAFLKASFSNTDNYFAHTNACLIDTGKKRILVDVGGGDKFQKTTGNIGRNLKAAGYDVKDIDKVILTHAHPDHMWGLLDTKSGEPVFPKADYCVNAIEWDYWTQDGVENKVPDGVKAFAAITKKTLLPIAAKTKRIKPGDEAFAGIEVIDTQGHTTGHISLSVTSKKEALIISGDVVHHPYVSFEHPDWHFGFDMDADKAVSSRRVLLERAVVEKSRFIGFHLPFPGVGHVVRKGKAYRWVPENWQWTL